MTDWAERLPRSDSDVGSTRRARSASRRVSSRAITRVMSRSVRAATSAKERAISSAGRAADGDRVVRGPVTTTPVVVASSGMARVPERTERDRCSLAKSSAATTFQAVRSTSATLTRPVKSAPVRAPGVERRSSPDPGVARRAPPSSPAAARTLGSGVWRRVPSAGLTSSRGGTTSPRGGRG
jgi:hypothetical protein